MKKIVFYLFAVAATALSYSQEYAFVNNNKREVFFENKSEVLIRTEKAPVSDMFINSLSAFGELSVDTGFSYQLTSIRCDDGLFDKIMDLCKTHPNLVSMYSPAFTLENDTSRMYCTGEVVVLLKYEEMEAEMFKLIKEMGCSISWKSPFCKGKYHISSTSNDGRCAFAVANKLCESGLFVYAVPDFYYRGLKQYTEDEYYDNQWGLYNWGQTGGEDGVDVHAESAWNITKGDSNIKVAVIDCGVDLSHPDLQGALLTGYNSSDGTNSGSYVFESENHGTICASIISAQHNSEYIAGVAPDCKLIPVRVTGGSGYDVISFMADGIDYAVSAGADVISMSSGIEQWSAYNPNEIAVAIDNALQYGRNGKGCVFVCASGNENSTVLPFPAWFEETISVGAVDHCGQRSGQSYIFDNSEVPCSPWPYNPHSPGSSYGEDLDVVAPGSLVPALDLMSNGGYCAGVNGTSVAVPHVAGVAALMLSVNPDLTWQQVKMVICATSQKVGTYTYLTDVGHPYGTWNEKTGYGLVDAGAAVLRAWEMANPDLYVKDDAADDGSEPNATASTAAGAPEITVLDGTSAVSTPTAGGTYTVHVTVHNAGDVASLAGKKLRLYSAYRQGSMPWPSAWTSNLSQPEGVAYAAQTGLVGECTLPAIAAGGSYDATVSWTVPTRTATAPSTGHPDYFTFGVSLLAVVEDGRPTVGLDQSGYNIDTLVLHNNNVARRDLTVRQYYPVLPPGPIILGITPNPAASAATVSYELPEGTTQATLTVVGVDGQVYRTLTVDAAAATVTDGTSTATLDIQGLPSGQYQLVLTSGPYAESKPLIVY